MTKVILWVLLICEKKINEIVVEWDDYTMRNEAVRLISARVATSREREIYYGE